MTDRSRPFPSTMKVRDALALYLAENGFTFEAYDAKYTDASFLGVRFKVPNTRKHRWAIMMHDLHHVATGFGTDLAGEGEVSVWELRRGLAGLDLYVSGIVFAGVVLGITVAPLRALAAWNAKGTARALWTTTRTQDGYDALLELTVGELRDRLHVPRGGLASAPRGLHSYAPAPI